MKIPIDNSALGVGDGALTLRDPLHEILREFLEKGDFDEELRNKLKAYREGEVYRYERAADPKAPGGVVAWAGARVADILDRWAEGHTEEAWRAFQALEELLREKEGMGMFEGDLYRLGAAIARGLGKIPEADRLDREYAAYREQYVDAFEARVVAAFAGLWAMPEQWAELAALLSESEEEEPVERLAGLGEWAWKLREELRALGQRVAGVFPLRDLAPASALAAAGPSPRPADLDIRTPDNRLQVHVRREADGGLWAWIETTDPSLAEQRVELYLGEEETVKRTATVALEALGEGRWGARVFLGRWEHLGLGAQPGLMVAYAAGGEGGVE